MPEPDTDNPIRLVKKDCGIHSGHEPGPCRKCARQQPRAGLQYGGTPWNAVISGVVGKRVKVAYNTGG